MFRKTLIAMSLAAGLFANAQADTAATPHSDGVGAAISDTAITTKVKTQLLTDDHLKTSKISVNTTNGVVTLTGSTASADAKTEAETTTKTIDGVKSVDNELIAPTTSTTASNAKAAVSDSWITTKVKSDLLADSVSKGFDVSVKTKHGVVMLKGTLPTQDAIDHVKDIASQVNGVKGVKTTALKVQAG